VTDCIWDVVEYATKPDFSDEVLGWTDANSHGSVMKAAPFTHWMPKPEAPELRTAALRAKLEGE
jgi:hypothetical protein